MSSFTISKLLNSIFLATLFSSLTTGYNSFHPINRPMNFPIVQPMRPLNANNLGQPTKMFRDKRGQGNVAKCDTFCKETYGENNNGVVNEKNLCQCISPIFVMNSFGFGRADSTGSNNNEKMFPYTEMNSQISESTGSGIGGSGNLDYENSGGGGGGGGYDFENAKTSVESDVYNLQNAVGGGGGGGYDFENAKTSVESDVYNLQNAVGPPDFDNTRDLEESDLLSQNTPRSKWEDESDEDEDSFLTDSYRTAKNIRKSGDSVRQSVADTDPQAKNEDERYRKIFENQRKYASHLASMMQNPKNNMLAGYHDGHNIPDQGYGANYQNQGYRPEKGYYGQPYAGQSYSGQPYAGLTNAGQAYAGHPYAGQTYAGQPYAGQPYVGSPYAGQTYGSQNQGYGVPVADAYNNLGVQDQIWAEQSQDIYNNVPGTAMEDPGLGAPTEEQAARANSQRSQPTEPPIIGRLVPVQVDGKNSPRTFGIVGACPFPQGCQQGGSNNNQQGESNVLKASNRQEQEANNNAQQQWDNNYNYQPWTNSPRGVLSSNKNINIDLNSPNYRAHDRSNFANLHTTESFYHGSGRSLAHRFFNFIAFNSIMGRAMGRSPVNSAAVDTGDDGGGGGGGSYGSENDNGEVGPDNGGGDQFPTIQDDGLGRANAGAFVPLW